MENEKKEDDLALKIEVWKKVVDVQMHFNELCLKVRNFAVSILGALLGAAAIAYRFAGQVDVLSLKVPTASIFVIISIVVWLGFFLMDRYWYHELLKGAVHHGQRIEDLLRARMPEIDLAHAIRDQSHESLKMNTAKKLNIFYLSIFAVQVLALVALLFGAVRLAS